MEPLTPIPLPLALPLWGLASVKVARSQTRKLFGKPHFVESDPLRTLGGEQDAWGYGLPTGQRLIVMFDVISSRLEIIADPPDLDPVLEALRPRLDRLRIDRYTEPVMLKY